MTQDDPHSDRPQPAQLNVRLLGMTDLHGYLRSYDYLTDCTEIQAGLTRLATMIRKARSEHPNCLLFDNGDTIQGTILADWATQQVTEGKTHPVINALNALRVDAATIGNHDFNFGIEAMEASYAAAEFPVVCANVVRQRGESPAQDQPFLPPWCLLERDLTDTHGQKHPLRIGVIGALPPQIMDWDYRFLNGRVEVRGIVEAIRHHVPNLRAAGADLVVVLAHSGLGDGSDDPQAEHAAAAVAGIEGIDAVIAGHSHRPFPSRHPSSGAEPDPSQDLAQGTVNGTPLVLPGYWGSHLGVIDLALDHGPDGWRVKTGRGVLHCGTHGPAPLPEDPELLALSAPVHQQTLDWLARPVGETATRLHSFFAMLEPTPALALVAEAKARAGAALLEGTALAELPLLSAVSPFKCGGRAGPMHFTDVPAGTLTLRHLTDLYLFPNSLRVLQISGAELREWLERSAGAFHQITPGKSDQPLLNPAQASYDFDSIFGATYRFDLTQPSRYDPETGLCVDPAARRVLDLRVQGRSVQDEDSFTIATNSYRSGGGGHFPGLSPKRVIAENLTSIRDLLADCVAQRQGPIKQPEVWRFAPIPETTAWINSGPAARSAPDDIARLNLQDLGDQTDGFARFEMTFP